MKSSTTAPMKATKIVPPIPPNGVEIPRALNSQPPMKAPTMPMTMSPMIPYPVPPITRDARTPATRPTTIQATIPIVSVLERVLSLTVRYGKRFQIWKDNKNGALGRERSFYVKYYLSASLPHVFVGLNISSTFAFRVVDGVVAVDGQRRGHVAGGSTILRR